MLICQRFVGRNWEQAWMPGWRIRFHYIYFVSVKLKMQVVWMGLLYHIGQTKNWHLYLYAGCLGDRGKYGDWSSSCHGSGQTWSQSGNHCKVYLPNAFQLFKMKYIRRSELLDKVKDQCIVQGGRASQVDKICYGIIWCGNIVFFRFLYCHLIFATMLNTRQPLIRWCPFFIFNNKTSTQKEQLL